MSAGGEHTNGIVGDDLSSSFERGCCLDGFTDVGTTPSGSGLSSDDGAASVSTLRASIPSALWPLLIEIYKAGAKRGSDEATSFDWGSTAYGKFHDELIDALHTWNNDGLAYDDPGYMDWEEIAAVVANATKA